jgi:hypothetical protein
MDVDAGMTMDASVDVDASVDAGMDVDAGMTMDAGTDAGSMVDAGMTVDSGMTADAGGCVPTGAVDEPDPAGLDVNCDGFDGDLSLAVFVDTVGGLDSNAGTQAAPKKTLAGAIGSNKAQVYLSTGTFTGSATFTTAIAVYGGYDASNWARTSTKTIINGALVAQPSSTGRVVFERLDVTAPTPATAGEASVALTLRGAANSSRITSCRLAGSAGADGADGLAAPTVLGGQAGHMGGIGNISSDAGAGGGAVSCDDAGLTLPGFEGGGGGDSLPGDGANGSDGTVGGAGGLTTLCVAYPCTALDGTTATAGADGTFSAVRPADPASGLGTVSGHLWVAPSLGTWTPAHPGRPGGGGGGGGAIIDAVSSVMGSRGGGGGGGGSGGCGGRSGTAGGSGGASIGLLLVDSSPTLTDVQLVSGNGGAGGIGGSAGTGGNGGVGALGGTGENTFVGSGGMGGEGGAGGKGGPGRQGPGGWGGPVIGLFCSGTAAPTRDGTTTWTSGAPGAGGTGDPAGATGSQPTSGYAVGCP